MFGMLRLLKACLFALNRIKIVLEMLLFCLGKKTYKGVRPGVQKRSYLVWHDWKAQL